MTARDMLPKDTVNIRENENGHSARGEAPCPKCGKIVPVAICSDVRGIWWYCPKDGLVDW
jgi:ribosomal protein S27AE